MKLFGHITTLHMISQQKLQGFSVNVIMTGISQLLKFSVTYAGIPLKIYIGKSL